jgi:hypothetical protein
MLLVGEEPSTQAGTQTSVARSWTSWGGQGQSRREAAKEPSKHLKAQTPLLGLATRGGVQQAEKVLLARVTEMQLQRLALAQAGTWVQTPLTLT